MKIAVSKYASHATELIKIRSDTRIMVFIESVTVKSYSKLQITVEGSNYCSDW